jgi:uncharacterized phiE125 gp8 family phage protein
VIELGETFSSSNFLVKDSNGTLTNATVTVTVRLPDGTTAAPTPNNPSTGTYSFDYTTTIIGRHEYDVSATGGVLGSLVRKIGGDVFHVDSPSTAAQLVGLAEAKAHLNQSASVTTDDEELRRVIATASGLVEAETRLWHRSTVIEEYDPANRLYLRSRPVVSVTSVVQDGTTLGATTYELTPIGDALRAAAGGSAPWSGTGKVTVTYVAGETVVPVPVRDAVLLTVAEIWKSQRGPAGLPLQGTAGYEDVDAEPSIAYSLPYGAQKLLEPWVRGPLMA